MKAVFFEMNEEEQRYLAGFLKPTPPLDVVFCKDKLTMDNIDMVQHAEIISVFVNSEITEEMMSALPSLKLIATRSTGFDHINTAFAKKKNIVVANVPSYGSRTVAEFTFGLILNLSRKISLARQRLLEGDNFDMTGLEGFDLAGKTLGVIGTGKIGKNVIKIARSFDMNVVAYDIFPAPEFAQENGFEYAELPALLSASDIVTLHTPYNESTHHIINKDSITLMKKGAYLINTARGELIETDALLKALTSNHLAGAGLDVFEAERELKDELSILAKDSTHLKDIKTLFEDQVLLDMPQVVATPHIAFYSQEAQREIERTTAENITNFLNGSPTNLV